MVKKLIFVFLFALMVLPFVVAVPPFQSSTSDKGYEIEVAAFGFLQQNQPHEFHFHVFNVSNGLPVTDAEGVECFFHLYNESGMHILELNATYEPSNVLNEWEVKVAGGNFSKLFMGVYVIQCNSDGFGGFAKVGYQVTYSGTEIKTPQSLIYILLFGVMFFIFIMLMWFIEKLPSSNTQDEEGKIMSISYLKYLRATFWFVEWIIFVGIIFLASNVAFAYLGEQMFAKILLAFYTICFSLTPLIIAIWVMWMFVKMYHDKQFQKLLNRGFFPQGKL